MGQEAETNVKLEAGTLKEIIEDFEQTHFRHRRGWLKSKKSGPNFMGRTVPKLLDLSKQGKTDLWELSIVGVCHKTPLLQANQTNILHFYLFAFSRD